MKVIIVDDDIATVDVIKNTTHWQDLGIDEVFTAYNITDAKKILKEQLIDIVISDIEMPQGNGIELLEWYRREGFEGEFLLLTCHESFEYAASAMKLKAAEYILKPFDVDRMEISLRKLIREIEDKKNLAEINKYGRWMKDNPRQLFNGFWANIFSGKINSNRDAIKREIESRRLDIDAESDYVLILSKITDIEKDTARFASNLIMFICENIHMELLNNDPASFMVYSQQNKNNYTIVSICKNDGRSPLVYKTIMENVRENISKILEAQITSFISKPIKVEDFYENYLRESDLIDQNVGFYGTAFTEEDISLESQKLNITLDLVQVNELLARKNKIELMNMLKDILNQQTRDHSLTSESLYNLQQELLQCIYTYLGKKDISASGLMQDRALVNLEKACTASVINFIKWANYIIDVTFEYEDKIQKAYTLSDKINSYIAEHYQEDIGRTEIANELYLAPEYLSKVYKKETGISLNEAISIYRVKQAKLLLERGERVSDVAEKVGFDNYTYFSTVFKKYEGITPNQYKKK